MLFPRLFFGFSLVSIIPLLAIGATLYVPDQYTTIQEAIDASLDGDTVLVAAGTYTGPGNMDLRVLEKSITLASEAGYEKTVIDCDQEGRAITIQNVSEGEVIIQGFTFTDGLNRLSQPEIGGGALYSDSCRLTIRNCLISGNRACSTSSGSWNSYGGGVYVGPDSTVVVEASVISGNESRLWSTESNLACGGGIACRGGTVILRGCTVSRNTAWAQAGTSDPQGCSNGHARGAGIYCDEGLMELEDTDLSENEATASLGDFYVIQLWARGGGAYTKNSQVAILSCSIMNNSCRASGSRSGGGLFFEGSGTAAIQHSRISGNDIDEAVGYFSGGGIYCSLDELRLFNCEIVGNRSGGVTSDGLNMVNCTVADNLISSDPYDNWSGIYCNSGSIQNSIVWGNRVPIIEECVSITYSNLQEYYRGDGNLQTDPLFFQASDGSYYLSQTGAGQSDDSPCVDAGNPEDEMFTGTTRSDHQQDWPVIDMGVHYVRDPARFIAAIPGPAMGNPPDVGVFPPEDGAAACFVFRAYQAKHFGARLSSGDLDGDGLDEILTGAGPGETFGPHVRGFQVDGVPLPGLSFLAYGTHNWGVNVATGDLDGDGLDDIVTGPGPGPVFGPHVRGWRYDENNAVSVLAGVNYLAYGTPKWGVNVASGDIDGDGFDEIVTGAGPGSVYGSHVRGWNCDGGVAAPIRAVSFMAYGSAKYGVRVTCGDVDGDGIEEIVTAPGPGSDYGAHIRGWNHDGGGVVQLPGYSFFAFPFSGSRYGAEIHAGVDLDDDGLADLIVGAGPDPESKTMVAGFKYVDGQIVPLFAFEAHPGLTCGATVVAGRY